MKFNDIQLKGNEVAVTRKEPETRIKSLGELYDREAKLVLIADESGSMSATMQRGATTGFVWRPEQLEAIRMKLEQLVAEVNANPSLLIVDAVVGFESNFDAPVVSDDEDEDEGDEDEDGDEGGDEEESAFVDTAPPAAFATEPEPTAPRLSLGQRHLLLLATKQSNEQYTVTPGDDHLKELIVKFNLTDELGIACVDLEAQQHRRATRMQLLRRMAKQEMEQRLAKCPKAKISVIGFGGVARVKFDEGTPEQLWEAIDNLQDYAGETNILAGIRKGVDVCRAKPSPIGVHHFVVVTDGADWTCEENIAAWVPNLKTSGVILDYIHIGDCGVNAGLQAACVALGGNFVNVNTEEQFQAKFIETFRRLLAPPSA